LRIVSSQDQTNAPHHYLINRETMQHIKMVVDILSKHYSRQDGSRLPDVAFNSTHTGGLHLSAAPYLFQYGNHHLTAQAIMACIRFLLHGLEVITPEGQPMMLDGLQIQSIFEADGSQNSSIVTDLLEAWLSQVHHAASDAQRTKVVVAEPKDLFLSHFATHINVQEAVSQSSEELQQLYEEVRRRAGPLSEDDW
jgi:hypothetical protein